MKILDLWPLAKLQQNKRNGKSNVEHNRARKIGDIDGNHLGQPTRKYLFLDDIIWRAIENGIFAPGVHEFGRRVVPEGRPDMFLTMITLRERTTWVEMVLQRLSVMCGSYENFVGASSLISVTNRKAAAIAVVHVVGFVINKDN